MYTSNNNVHLKKCTKTDGVAIIIEKHVGQVKLMRHHSKFYTDIQYSTKRSSFSNGISKTFAEILAQIVKILNYIKANDLNPHLF